MILYRSFSSLLFQLSSMGIFTILVFTVCGQQERFILCYDDTTVQHQEVLIFTYYIKLEWKISLIIGIKNHKNSPVWQWRQDLIKKKFFRSYYFRFNFEVNFLYNHLLYSHTFLCHTGRKKAIFFSLSFIGCFDQYKIWFLFSWTKWQYEYITNVFGIRWMVMVI